MKNDEERSKRKKKKGEQRRRKRKNEEEGRRKMKNDEERSKRKKKKTTKKMGRRKKKNARSLVEGPLTERKLQILKKHEMIFREQIVRGKKELPGNSSRRMHRKANCACGCTADLNCN